MNPLRILGLALGAAGCSLVGQNEAYIPELGRYDYVLEDTLRITGRWIVETGDGSGIGYRWEVPAFGPAGLLPNSARYTDQRYIMRVPLDATDEIVVHTVSRNGRTYLCTARIEAARGSRFRAAACSLSYLGPD